jgi:hypothetical protein
VKTFIAGSPIYYRVGLKGSSGGARPPHERYPFLFATTAVALPSRRLWVGSQPPQTTGSGLTRSFIFIGFGQIPLIRPHYDHRQSGHSEVSENP